MPATGNLIVNGGFDSPGYDANDGKFLQGQEFDGWVMARSSTGGTRVMQIWTAEHGHPHAGPFPNGPWAGLNGTICQSIPTERGASYRLRYSSRAAGWSTRSPAASWAGGNIVDVLIDGLLVQTIATVAEPLHTDYELYFTATSSRTLLSFGIIERGAAGIDNVSVVEITGVGTVMESAMGTAVSPRVTVNTEAAWR